MRHRNGPQLRACRLCEHACWHTVVVRYFYRQHLSRRLYAVGHELLDSANRKDGDGWTYTYTADKLRGFKQTHQPSPWINDYGQFTIMPETGEAPVFDEEKRASWFSHKAEVATPYYYRAYLADYDVVTELAPTERAAIMRITFPENKS